MPLEKSGGVLPTSPSYLGNAFYLGSEVFDDRQPEVKDAQGNSYRAYKGFWANYCLNHDPRKVGADCRRTQLPTKGNYMTPALKTSFQGDRAYEVRPTFRSYANADACTLAQIASYLKFPRERVRELLRGGSVGLRPFIRDTGNPQKEAALLAKANVHTFPGGEQGLFLNDVCVLEIADHKPMPKGIVLDFEVWDKRTPAQALAFFHKVANLVHEKNVEFILYTNSLESPITMAANGLDPSTIHQVMDAVDGFSPIVWSGATLGGHQIGPAPRTRTFQQSLQANVAVMQQGTGNRPLPKFMPTVSLFDITPKEAADIHSAVQVLRGPGLKLWNNGLKIVDGSGNCRIDVNNVIECLATGNGNCSGDAQSDRLK